MEPGVTLRCRERIRLFHKSAKHGDCCFCEVEKLVREGKPKGVCEE
jgi:hypothetical protein